jgi:acetyl esterase/lipase
MRRLSIALAVVSVFTFLTAARSAAQSRVERNVVYGMYSGLALLMDVHQSGAPKGLGVIYVAGSAWQAPLGYGASSLKDSNYTPEWLEAFVREGFTVFVVNHRATPRFHFPEPVEDVQRAVRYVRHHAARFGVDPARLGGVGESSGAHLIALVGMLAAPGIAGDRDPVNKEPATLQALVTRAAPADLGKIIGGNTIATAVVVALVNRLPTPMPDDQAVYRAASPLTHVTASSPPALLTHGDTDDTVPFQQAVDMEAALRKANVPVKLLRVPGGTHNGNFGTSGRPHPDFPNVLSEAVSWLTQYLSGNR